MMRLTKPWSDYKKGLIDLIISAVTMLTFLNYNPTAIYIGGMELIIPKAVYIILGIVLIWISINVTNCSDGVDGLCASLCCVAILSFSLIFREALGNYVIADFLFVAVLFAYLYFNTSPSSMLMGDAGSRALGFLSRDHCDEITASVCLSAPCRNADHRRRTRTGQDLPEKVFENLHTEKYAYPNP